MIVMLAFCQLASWLVSLKLSCAKGNPDSCHSRTTQHSASSAVLPYGTFAIPTGQNARIFTSHGYVSRMRLLYAAPSMTAGDLSQSKPLSGISDACALTMSLHATVLNLQSHLNVLEKSVASLRIEPGA
jgi:hypothetical protein